MTLVGVCTPACSPSRPACAQGVCCRGGGFNRNDVASDYACQMSCPNPIVADAGSD
jgi:hypothetical protein